MDDIKFLFIGESANMTCTMINKQTIQNYSVENLNIRVNKCGEIKSMHRQIGQKNGSKEIHVRDVIEDLPCRDQKYLDYTCFYDRKKRDSCIVERTLIYFDCKIILCRTVHFVNVQYYGTEYVHCHFLCHL